LAKACELASGTINCSEPEVRHLLSAVSRSNVLSQDELEQARHLAETADERYFALQHSGAREEEWSDWYFKARLLSTVSVGFGGASWSDAVDAVYELTNARDDPSEIIALIKSEIDAL
jgi:hypothetical protein